MFLLVSLEQQGSSHSCRLRKVWGFTYCNLAVRTHLMVFVESCIILLVCCTAVRGDFQLREDFGLAHRLQEQECKCHHFLSLLSPSPSFSSSLPPSCSSYLCVLFFHLHISRLFQQKFGNVNQFSHYDSKMALLHFLDHVKEVSA